jgi:hypothetical protein
MVPTPAQAPTFVQHLKKRWANILVRASIGGLILVVATFVGIAIDIWKGGEWSIDDLKLAGVVAVPFGFPIGFLFSLVMQLATWKSWYRTRQGVPESPLQPERR